MPKLIIYNSLPCLYYMAESFYTRIKEYSNDEFQINILNCVKNIQFLNDNIYIIFNPFNKYDMIQMPSKYIIYNFENLTNNNIYHELLTKAILVIDFSIHNVIKLNDHGIDAYFMPCISTNNCKFKDADNIVKDIDVLFIGNLSNKRKLWLNNIINENYNIKIITNLFFEKSIEYFARSKIVLNIHYNNEYSLLEMSRIIPSLENECIILSEIYNDEYYNDIYKNIIKKTNYNTLKSDIDNILNNYMITKQIVYTNNNEVVKDNDLYILSKFILFIKNIIN